jgi:hypothetical protein
MIRREITAGLKHALGMNDAITKTEPSDEPGKRGKNQCGFIH